MRVQVEMEFHRQAMRKRLAQLTAEEGKEWLMYFDYYVGEGCADKLAAQLSWTELQDIFPRLKRFDRASLTRR
jgi:hypothetical protein